MHSCLQHVHVFDSICVGGATRRAATKVTHLVTQRLVAELRWLLWCHIGSTHNLGAISVSIFISFRAAAGRGPHFSPFPAGLRTVPVGCLMNGSCGLAPDRLLWTSSRLAPISSYQTRLSKCSRPAPLNLFLAVSPRLVGCHQLAAGRFQSAGFLADPLAICPIGVSQLLVAWLRSASFLRAVSRSWFPAGFSLLVCVHLGCVRAGSSYMISGWLI